MNTGRTRQLQMKENSWTGNRPRDTDTLLPLFDGEFFSPTALETNGLHVTNCDHSYMDTRWDGLFIADSLDVQRQVSQ